jgi:hypothetical protein
LISDQPHDGLTAEPALRPSVESRSRSRSIPVVAAAASAGAGLILVALAYNAARLGHSYGDALYWPGLFAIYLPSAWLMQAAGSSRRDRLTAALICGVGLYMVKVLHDPYGFTFNDELARFRTADDIYRSGHLFDVNPLNVITPSFPGFETATAAIARLSGASLFHSGLAVIGAARVIVMLSVFLVVERVTDSSRVAGFATALYAANPNFLLQGSQFSYESVGLPIAFVAVLAATGPRVSAPGRPLLAATLVAGAGAIITHHAASYALVVTLAGWAALTAVFRRRGQSVALPGSWVAAVALAVLVGAWLVGVAHDTINYLGNDPAQGVHQLADILSGKGGERKPFGARGGGSHIPVAERVVGAASVLLLLTGVLAGLVTAIRRRRFTPLWIVFLAAAALYPVTVALRLTPSGQETAARSSEYLFIGIGAVTGLAAVGVHALRDRVPRAVLGVAAVAALAILFAGGVVVGAGRTARTPGPYLVGGGTRSYQPESVDAARWLLWAHGPDNHLVADGENSVIMGSVGRQMPQGYGGVGRGAWPIYFSATFGPDQLELVRKDQARFVVVDRRLARSLPTDGSYINKAEPDRRLTDADLAKFATVRGLVPVYDSGNIIIYDSSALLPDDEARG